MSIQTELNAIYEAFINKLRDDRGGQEGVMFRELSAPFLIKVIDDYESAEPRIAIVGQETYGWMGLQLSSFLESRGIDDALDEYEKFDFGASWYASPFWKRFREVGRRLLGARYTTRAVAWMNLFKFNHDVDESNVCPMVYSPHLASVLRFQSDIFSKEVHQLAPRVLIFFTGPIYDQIINRFYPGCRFEPLGGYNERQVARVRHDGLPELTFRTYHPGYIDRHRAVRSGFIEAILNAAGEAS